MPAQMPGAAGAAMAVAQHKKRHIAVGSAQAQPAAGGEIEKFGLSPHIRNHRSDRPAGHHFLGRPQEFGHIRRAHDHNLGRIHSRPGEPGPIGHAELLGILGHLQVKDRRPARRDQAPSLRKCKPEAGAAIAQIVGKHLLHQPARKHGKTIRLPDIRPPYGLQQGRLALDIGNDIPQRGKALILGLGLHDDRSSEQNRNI